MRDSPLLLGFNVCAAKSVKPVRYITCHKAACYPEHKKCQEVWCVTVGQKVGFHIE